MLTTSWHAICKLFCSALLNDLTILLSSLIQFHIFLKFNIHTNFKRKMIDLFLSTFNVRHHLSYE
jgi:hypothetical protein